MTGEIYLSKSEFAASQGWRPSYVTKLKDQGRLIMSPDGKKVDVAATLAKLQETADPSKVGVTKRHADERNERDVGQHTRSRAPAALGNDGDGHGKFQEARARREHFLAQQAELEYRRMCGELVERAPIADAAAKTGRMLRDAMLGLPTKIAPKLAVVSDPWEVEKLLRDAIRVALEDISRLTAGDLQRALGDDLH